jgi:hypothetical protein
MSTRDSFISLRWNSKNMRVLLIFPSADQLNLSFAVKTFSPPLGILYIASSLREAGVEVDVIDQTGENLSDENLLRRVER